MDPNQLASMRLADLDPHCFGSWSDGFYEAS